MVPSRFVLIVSLSAFPFFALGGGGHDSGCQCGKHGVGESTLRILADEGKPNFPPPRIADHKHMRLELRIDDMDVPKASAVQTLTLEPLDSHMSTLTLDARAMNISGVRCAGHVVTHSHDGRTLSVTFQPPVAPGSTIDLITTYEINDPELGFIWTVKSSDFPDRASQIHTQGQPETNSYWFPCHDFPDEKLTTEVLVTLPAGYLVSSNGRLVAKTRQIRSSIDAEGSVEMSPFETWHWLQDKPHVNYLVSLVIGKFDVVDVGTPALSMPVYVPPGRGGDVNATYGRTAEMVSVFSQLFDEPYPWDRYAQLVVWNFGAGGMENTSCTTMYDTAIFEKAALIDHDLEPLISHELAHQWWGDLLTCKTWEHIWLNEGWATYSTALWQEQRKPAKSDPPGSTGADNYFRSIQGDFDDIIEKDKPEAPDVVGMVSNIYGHPWETFRRKANPYSKGASILHMLRMRLGSELFFRGTREFMDQFKFGSVETADFRQSLEAASGQSLEPFFNQWCVRPGVPIVTITTQWDSSRNLLLINGKQTQRINAANPAFEFDLPFLVSMPAGSAERKSGGSDPYDLSAVLVFSGAEVNLELPLSAEPRMLIFNPRLEVLAGLTIEQPRERWLAQLADGPTLPSRIQAARALAKDTSTSGAASLSRTALDRSLPIPIRVEAVKSLEKRAAHTDLESLFTSAVDRWELREAVTESLASLVADKKANPAQPTTVARLLANRAQKDESLRVRAAAIKGLGKLKASDYSPLIKSALESKSQSDILRLAAIEAFASMDARTSIALIRPVIESPGNARTRAVAAEQLGRLHSTDPDAVMKILASMLEDKQLRARYAAGEALVNTKDPNAAALFDAHLPKAKTEEFKWQLMRWKRDLEKTLAEKK